MLSHKRIRVPRHVNPDTARVHVHPPLTEADILKMFEDEDLLHRDQDAAMAREAARNEVDQMRRSILASERYWLEKTEQIEIAKYQ